MPPVLSREDDRILMDSADMNAGRRVVVVSGAADVGEPCLVLFSHRLDDIRSLGGEVVLFERIGSHVVEFEFRLAPEVFASEPTAVEEFPSLASCCKIMVKDGYVTAMRLDIDGTIAPSDFLALEQGQDASAVEFETLRLRYAACFEDRGEHVDVGGDSVGRCAGFDGGQPLEEERRMDAALVDVAFHAFHARDVSAAVGAVVDHEYNDGVLGDAKLIEPGEEFAHVVIDVGDHCEYSSPFVGIVVVGEFVPFVLREVLIAQVHRFVLFVEVLRDIIKWGVRGVCGNISKEVLRLRDTFRHPAHCLLEVHIGAIALVLLRFAVVHENWIGVFAFAAGRISGLAYTAAAVYDGLGEALIHRPHGVVVAEVPFSEDAGFVSCVAEDFGDGDLLRLHHRPADPGIDYPRAVVVSAGHQARPGGSTYGTNVEILHRGAAADHGVDIGGSYEVVARSAEIAVALIVGHHENDVGPFPCPAGAGQR